MGSTTTGNNNNNIHNNNSNSLADSSPIRRVIVGCVMTRFLPLTRNKNTYLKIVKIKHL